MLAVKSTVVILDATTWTGVCMGATKKKKKIVDSRHNIPSHMDCASILDYDWNCAWAVIISSLHPYLLAWWMAGLYLAEFFFIEDLRDTYLGCRMSSFSKSATSLRQRFALSYYVFSLVSDDLTKIQVEFPDLCCFTIRMVLNKQKNKVKWEASWIKWSEMWQNLMEYM